MLVRLVYASKAAANIRSKDMINIGVSADTHNQDNDVTGALVFGDGYFLQVLEGDRDAVWETFSRIQVDDRHSDILMIESVEIQERTYSEWTMRLLELQNLDGNSLSYLVKKHSSSSAFQPHTMTAQQCVSFAFDLYTAVSGNANAGHHKQPELAASS